ncbi:MAG: Phosphate-specific transport system accessory protein PhoU [Firmicutes bacterium]|nr:Phosphate-specific transport system accessory protein PhoU [Bacillota bacterium]
MLRQNFQKDLAELHTKLLSMGGRIEQMLRLALEALRSGHPEPGEAVDNMEIIIDEMAVEIDEFCIELIAKQQPVGQDLRRIIGAMRLAIDMERVADISTNIVEQSRLLQRPLLKPLVDIPKMVDVASSMLEDSLNALINSDVALANDVWHRDDIVDELCERILVELRGMMSVDASLVPKALPLLIVAIQVERIADHATNIAESVAYIVEGKRIVYHKKL